MDKKVNTSPVEEELSEAQERVEDKLTEAEKLSKKIKRRERGVKQYQYFILRVAILLVILWLLFFVFIGVTHMPNGDMYPRIDSGDFVMFYRLDKDVKYQDIIVFEKMVEGQKRVLIARVLGAPGDTVEITDGAVIVNGNAISETNIFYRTAPYDGEGLPEYPITLGPDECFVLADYRNGGADSRYFGPVDKDEILGTVITVLRRNNL